VSSSRQPATRLVRRLRRMKSDRRDGRLVSPFDVRAPALVLSPHLDHATLDCFYVLDSSHRVEVVNLFAGVPPPELLRSWDVICGASDLSAHWRERIAEDADAMKTFGIQPINLDYLDAQRRETTPFWEGVPLPGGRRRGCSRRCSTSIPIRPCPPGQRLHLHAARHGSHPTTLRTPSFRCVCHSRSSRDAADLLPRSVLRGLHCATGG
jgi:hypothetical protein